MKRDVLVWGLAVSGGFTIKSMYLDLLIDHTKSMQKYIWKMKVSLKIKVFYFLHFKVILTKDNPAKQN
jgi:hypothetical protein